MCFLMTGILMNTLHVISFSIQLSPDYQMITELSILIFSHMCVKHYPNIIWQVHCLASPLPPHATSVHCYTECVCEGLFRDHTEHRTVGFRAKWSIAQLATQTSMSWNCFFSGCEVRELKMNSSFFGTMNLVPNFNCEHELLSLNLLIF